MCSESHFQYKGIIFNGKVNIEMKNPFEFRDIGDFRHKGVFFLLKSVIEMNSFRVIELFRDMGPSI